MKLRNGEEIEIPEGAPSFGFAYPFNTEHEQRQADKAALMDFERPGVPFDCYVVATGIYTLRYPFAREPGPLMVGVYAGRVVCFVHVGIAWTAPGHRGRGLGSEVFAEWVRRYGPENYAQRQGAKFTEAGLRMVVSGLRKVERAKVA